MSNPDTTRAALAAFEACVRDHERTGHKSAEAYMDLARSNLLDELNASAAIAAAPVAEARVKVAPLRRGATGVCSKSVCDCERLGLGNECLWLDPAPAAAGSAEPVKPSTQEPSRCGLTECHGKPRCKMCKATGADGGAPATQEAGPAKLCEGCTTVGTCERHGCASEDARIAGLAALAAPQAPAAPAAPVWRRLTDEEINDKIGPDEGDREAVTAVVRETESALARANGATLTDKE